MYQGNCELTGVRQQPLGNRRFLNSHPLINGAPNSQHTEGKACDFIIKGMTPKQVVEKVIASGIEFDQVIDELTWTHISFNKGNNRKQVLKISS